MRLAGLASGFDEALFEQILRHPRHCPATPIVEIEAKLARPRARSTLLGVDIFTLARVAPRCCRTATTGRSALRRWPKDRSFSARRRSGSYGVQDGRPLPVQAGSRRSPCVAGACRRRRWRRWPSWILPAPSCLRAPRQAVTRIDLIVADGSSPESLRRSLSATLPAGVQLEAPEAASEQSRA